VALSYRAPLANAPADPVSILPAKSGSSVAPSPRYALPCWHASVFGRRPASRSGRPMCWLRVHVVVHHSTHPFAPAEDLRLSNRGRGCARLRKTARCRHPLQPDATSRCKHGRRSETERNSKPETRRPASSGAHLKRERIVHDLTGAEKHCAGCGKDLRLIAEETSERYKYLPHR
jgi:hypothetical protein